MSSVTTDGKPVLVEIEPNKLELDDDVELDGNVNFIGRAFRGERGIHIEGTITAAARLKCTRCGEPVERQLKFDFADIFVDSDDIETGTELEIGYDDLDVSPVSGGMINVNDIIREQIILELPEQIFCRDDCKGLCHKCGENRNLIDCSCDLDEVDPRWAALKNLN